MGFDVPTFHAILDAGFEARWNSQPIPRSDVPQSSVPRPACRSLDAPGALGLVLHFLTSTMLEVSLMQIFALVPSTVSRFINFALTILLDVLRGMPDAHIQWPSGEQFQELNRIIVDRHPMLTGAFGSIDGLNLAVQTSTNLEIENATYNGWLHEHFVSSVLVFGATGELFACMKSYNNSNFCSQQVKLLQPNSMHPVVGMTPVSHEISMRNYEWIHQKAITWYAIQHSLVAQIKSMVESGHL